VANTEAIRSIPQGIRKDVRLNDGVSVQMSKDLKSLVTPLATGNTIPAP
jgi:hypothetical protein